MFDVAILVAYPDQQGAGFIKSKYSVFCLITEAGLPGQKTLKNGLPVQDLNKIYL